MGTKKTDDRRAETLHEFDAALADYLGREAGFEAAVRELAAVRTDIARIEARRREIHDAMKKKFAGGVSIARPAGGAPVHLYTTTVRQVRPRAVPSAVIKKADPVLWEKAKTWKPFVTTKVPVSVSAAELGLGEYRLPPAPYKATDSIDVLVQRYQSPVFDVLAGLREREKAAVFELNRIRETVGDWDGAAVTFADGWQVGVRRWQYDSDELKRVAPDVWDSLAVESVITYDRLRTIDLSLAVAQGMLEISDLE
ncbi:hypothetical protein SEA_ANTONIA_66 [Mycobacterium phage Antonia]|uniref:Uncharacterized protein n=1 Tax=Mycobacterium phage Antonia TaxID=2499031 RepID=A0A3S9UQZ8_9CAUD|nr:hypothetical protein SEA_ANTONIA_66 [Mycobacterium phage Antonia]